MDNTICHIPGGMVSCGCLVGGGSLAVSFVKICKIAFQILKGEVVSHGGDDVKSGALG